MKWDSIEIEINLVLGTMHLNVILVISPMITDINADYRN